MNKKITIYTDGAARGNPGPGGYGIVLMSGQYRKELSQGYRLTTNNRMELLAVIVALETLKIGNSIVTIYTDSKYVMQGIQDWLAGWKNNGWRTAGRKPVKNQDLWQALDEQTQQHQIQWHWVKGHSGDPGNELADALANRGIDEL